MEVGWFRDGVATSRMMVVVMTLMLLSLLEDCELQLLGSAGLTRESRE